MTGKYLIMNIHSGKKFITIGIAALALGFPSHASGLEATLKLAGAPGGLPSGYGNCWAQEAKPGGEWKLPALLAAKPLYVVVTLGDREHLAVLDSKHAADAYYSRLWFDRDGDRDLTDEKPLDGKVYAENSDFYDTRFASIEATVKNGDILTPYIFVPGVRTGGTGPAGEKIFIFTYAVQSFYHSVFTVEGVRYYLWLGDENANGRFTDRAKLLDIKTAFTRKRPVSFEGDKAYISESDSVSITDGLYLGDLLLMGKTLFEMTIDIAQEKIILTELKTGLHPVKLPMPFDRLTLYAPDGSRGLMAYKPSGDVVMLPRGSYRLGFYQVFRGDEQGDLWRLRAGGTKESPVITVAPGGAADLTLGEPYETIIDLPPEDYLSAYRNSTINLSFIIGGAGGEIVTELIRIRGNSTKIPLSKTANRSNYPKEPAYTIVKPDGEIAARGSFEYG